MSQSAQRGATHTLSSLCLVTSKKELYVLLFIRSLFIRQESCLCFSVSPAVIATIRELLLRKCQFTFAAANTDLQPLTSTLKQQLNRCRLPSPTQPPNPQGKEKKKKRGGKESLATTKINIAVTNLPLLFAADKLVANVPSDKRILQAVVKTRALQKQAYLLGGRGGTEDISGERGGATTKAKTCA